MYVYGAPLQAVVGRGPSEAGTHARVAPPLLSARFVDCKRGTAVSAALRLCGPKKTKGRYPRRSAPTAVRVITSVSNRAACPRSCVPPTEQRQPLG